MINLQYEIVGTELLPRGCALLLYSISQLLPAITEDPLSPPTHKAPHTVHYIYQMLYKRGKHLMAALKVSLPLGLGGLMMKEEAASWPTMHLLSELGKSDTMRALKSLFLFMFNFK